MHRCPTCLSLVPRGTMCCGNPLAAMIVEEEMLEGGFGPGLGGGSLVGEMLEVEGLMTGNPAEILEGEILEREGFF